MRLRRREKKQKVEPKGLVMVAGTLAFPIERVYLDDGVLKLECRRTWESTSPLTVYPDDVYSVFGPDAVKVFGSSLLLDRPISVKGPGAEMILTLPIGIELP